MQLTDQELAIAGVSIVAVLLIMLAYYIIRIIAYWRIFTKAGEKGWKSIIPFYNVYVQYQFTWTTTMGIIYLVLYCIGNVLMNQDGTALSTVGSLMVIAAFVMDVIDMNKLSKAFGHGTGFTVGLVLLKPIFLMILGFGGSQYSGNPSEA